MGRPKGSKNKRPYVRTRGVYGTPPAHKAVLAVFARLGIEISAKEASLLRTGWRNHRGRAREYGIKFLLSFEEWLKIWWKSGHMYERGTHRGQYVMARFGDKGPYAVGNVKIIKSLENIKEAWPKIQKILLSNLQGNTYVKGRLWVTNGEEERRILKNTPVPEGWWFGRIGHTKETKVKISRTLLGVK